MTREDAEDILREEFARRGLSPASQALAHYATTFHRGPWWPVLHPRQARRQGWRSEWSWSSSEPDWVTVGSDDLVAFSKSHSAATRAAIRTVETAMSGQDVPTIEARLVRELRARDVYMSPPHIHLEALRISDPEWGRKDPAALKRLVAEISSPAGAQQEAAFGQEWDRVAERLEEALDSMRRLGRCSISSHRTVDGVTFEIRIDPWSARRATKLQRIAAPMHVKVTPF